MTTPNVSKDKNKNYFTPFEQLYCSPDLFIVNLLSVWNILGTIIVCLLKHVVFKNMSIYFVLGNKLLKTVT